MTFKWCVRCLKDIRENRSFNCRLVHYVQGQSPESRVREYFYYVDHQGQLFLDDARIKNFTSCFKEKQFLKFFFSQLEANATGRYTDTFPYVSRCGRERNFVRCDDLPVVFTELECHSADMYHLMYAGGTMSVAFQPEQVVMLPETGRVYHVGPANGGGVGLIKSSLAIELSKYFEFADGGSVPTHLVWQGQKHELTKSILTRLTAIKRAHSSSSL